MTHTETIETPAVSYKTSHKGYKVKSRSVQIDIDEDEERTEIPMDEFNISYMPNDFNIKTIFSSIESGTFKIPPFQRNYVWDVKRASKLIESLLIGLPIPQIFLYENEKKEYLVIDGQQRLMSIYYFMKQKFPVKERRAELKNKWNSGSLSEVVLKNNSYFKDFKLKLPDSSTGRQNKYRNRTYATLEQSDKELFDFRTIRCVIIRQNAPKADDSCVFEIFHRLNSGGINLHPQEIRMSLYYSKFYDMLNELNQSPSWRKLLGSAHPEFHTKDIEIILRGFAFLDSGNKYTPSLIKFLNNFSKKVQKNNLETNNYFKNLFLSFLNACKDMPEDIFVKNDKFNLALFEAVFVAVCEEPFKNKTIITKELDPSLINALSQDEEFVESTQKNTTSSVNVKKRLNRAKTILNL